MSNLTVAVDAELIKRARMRAIEQGTSLSAKVRDYLQSYVDEAQDGLSRQREEATARLMAALDSATAKSRPDTAPVATPRRRRTLRDELYAGDFRERDRPAPAAGKARRAR
jgi:hypothetical protein